MLPLSLLASLAFGSPIAWDSLPSDKIRLPRRITFEQLDSASPYQAIRSPAAARTSGGNTVVAASRFTDAKGVGHLLVRSRARKETAYLFRTRAGKESLIGMVRTPTEILHLPGHVELRTPIRVSGSSAGYSVASDSGGVWRVCGDFAYQTVRSENVPCDTAGREGLCSLLLWQAQKDAQAFRDSRCLAGAMEGHMRCIPPPPPTDIELKPMILLYPDSALAVDVELDASIRLVSVYPKPSRGIWHMRASPDGELQDIATSKRYSGLFWESEGWTPPPSDTGLVVRGTEFAETLDSLLERRGLNFREREEFVTFWISRVARHPWVSIQFQDQAFAAAHPVRISPRPDVFLRTFVVFQGMDIPRRLEPPRVSATVRHGFVAVEWGGKELAPIGH